MSARARAGSRSTSASRQTELHGERDQLLLRPVVDVALQLAGARVLRRHDPPPRLAQVLHQRDVAEDEPGLRGKVAGEALLRRVHRVVRRGEQREGPSRSWPDGAPGRRRDRSGKDGRAPTRALRRRFDARAPPAGHAATGPQLVADAQPDASPPSLPCSPRAAGPSAAARRRWSRSRRSVRRTRLRTSYGVARSPKTTRWREPPEGNEPEHQGDDHRARPDEERGHRPVRRRAPAR